MKFAIFLDDERRVRDVKWIDLPLVAWTIARDYDQFVDIIKRLGVPYIVSFDHDLTEQHYAVAGEKPDYSILQKTGYHCAKFLIEYCVSHNVEFPRYYIHSLNLIGAKNIKELIDNYLYTL